MPIPSRQEDLARVPTHPTPGRSFVTRQAVTDLVRAATLGSYGVTGFAARPHRTPARAPRTRPSPASRSASATTLDIELDLTVAYGVPIAEVARQVDSAVRYAIRHALGREVGRVTIHVDGLRFGAGGCAADGHPRPRTTRRSARPRRQRDGRRLMVRRACDGEACSAPSGRRSRTSRRTSTRSTPSTSIPVPDGDTGSNMLATVQAALEEAEACRRPAGRTDRCRHQLRGAHGRARQLGGHHQPDLPRAWPRGSAARAGSTASTSPTRCRRARRPPTARSPSRSRARS